MSKQVECKHVYMHYHNAIILKFNYLDGGGDIKGIEVVGKLVGKEVGKFGNNEVIAAGNGGKLNVGSVVGMVAGLLGSEGTIVDG